MEVLFCDLPTKLSAQEIRRLVSSAILPRGVLEHVKGVLFFGQRIKRLEFKIITELKSGEECRYGIAVIEPERSAERIIHRLRENKFCGYRFTVREYKNRSYSNDRRDVAWRKREWGEDERRQGDRRKPAQYVKKN